MPYAREADPDRNQQAQPYDPSRPGQALDQQQQVAPTRRSSQSSQSLLERYSSHGSQDGKDGKEKSPYSGPGPSIADLEGAQQAGGAVPGVMRPHIQFM